MAYTVKNYKTKKALVADVKAGVRVEVYQPGGMFPMRAGRCSLEGPHYPEPHKWYVSAEVIKDAGTFYAVKVK